MMNSVGNVVMGLTVAVSIFVSVVVWRGLSQEAHHRARDSREMAFRLDQLAREWGRVVQRSAAAARVIQELRSDVRRLLDGQAAASSVGPSTVDSSPEEDLADDLDLLVDDAEAVPPLPDEVNPSAILRRFRESPTLSDILQDPAINPGGTKPDYLQGMRIFRELVRANAQIDIVNSDLQVEVAEASARLAEAREFIDYAPGDKYMVEEGVFTSAEKTESGHTRMYYLYPEEFPAVYELKKRRKEIASESLRRVIVLLRHDSGE